MRFLQQLPISHWVNPPPSMAYCRLRKKQKTDHGGSQARCRSSSINDPGAKLFPMEVQRKKKEAKKKES